MSLSLARARARGAPAASAAHAPVSFLVFDAFGRGGVARTVLNLANQLADHRDVRIVSLFRGAEHPVFDIDTRVALHVLVDRRAGRTRRWQRMARRMPSRMRPVPAERRLSLLTDLVLRHRLSRVGGIVVATRPALVLAAALWCPPRTRLVGQDHKNFPTRFANRRQSAVLRRVVPALDAYVVLTHADADDYRDEFAAHPGTRIEVIRNALPWPVAITPAPLCSTVVVTAGRLAREKGFDRMIDAFARVAPDHPEWELHIHGEGPERPALTKQIRSLGLDGRIRLCGYTADLRGVLSEASVFAMASRAEGFPMVLIEAMSVGLPVVAFDCPRGPAEIVEDGTTGVLVADGDITGFADGLRRLIGDAELRRRCGRNALGEAHRYTADTVLHEWLSLFADLDRSPARSSHRHGTGTSRRVHPGR